MSLQTPESSQPSSASLEQRVASLSASQLQALAKALEPKRTAFWAHSPTPTQRVFLLLNCREALYGGAAGGGKSDALLMGAMQYVDCPSYSAILFRRTYADLSKPGALMDRAGEWLRGTAARWNEQKKQWKFPSGAILAFGYLEHEHDVYAHQGAEYQFIGFDELTQFSERQYLYLGSRLRRLQARSHIPLRMRSASNPGGIGHQWVRRRFLVEGPASGRTFVPARLEDNPHLDRAEYERSLAALDPVTRAQLRRGDWSVRDKDNSLVPEWTDIQARACTRFVERPPYFSPYVVGDIGSRDLTVWLFSWFWFEKDLVVVEDELALKDPGTDQMILEVRAKELELWSRSPKEDLAAWRAAAVSLKTDKPIPIPSPRWLSEGPKRFSDVDYRLAKDFQSAGMTLTCTKKDDALGHRNSARARIGRAGVVIHPRCRTLLLTLESAVWNDKRTDFLRGEDIGHADAWAALVYKLRNINYKHNPVPAVVPHSNLLAHAPKPLTGTAKVLAEVYGRHKKRAAT